MTRKSLVREIGLVVIVTLVMWIGAGQSAEGGWKEWIDFRSDDQRYSDAYKAYKKKDYGTALKEWRSLAKRYHSGAQARLGNAYRDGKGVPKDYKEAVRWYREAAEQGWRLAWAQVELGRMYENGFGVPKDYKEAMRWYRKAADQGYAWAQTNLGWMYENGFGVPKDYKEAVRWWRKAADQGSAIAQANIGEMYRDEKGVPRDYKEAVRWYRKAVEQGYGNAQYELGLMYRKGKGVLKDVVMAVLRKNWIPCRLNGLRRWLGGDIPWQNPRHGHSQNDISARD